MGPADVLSQQIFEMHSSLVDARAEAASLKEQVTEARSECDRLREELQLQSVHIGYVQKSHQEEQNRAEQERRDLHEALKKRDRWLVRALCGCTGLDCRIHGAYDPADLEGALAVRDAQKR